MESILELISTIIILAINISFLLLICVLFMLVYYFIIEKNIKKLEDIMHLIPLSFYFILYGGLYPIASVYYSYFFSNYNHELFMLLGFVLFFYGLFFVFNIIYYLLIWKYILKRTILLTIIPYFICLVTLFIFKNHL